MSGKVRILVVGVGTMGVAHAKAYHALEGFEICGLTSRSIRARRDLPAKLAGYTGSRISIGRWLPRGPMRSRSTPGPAAMPTSLRAMDAGCHVFLEKPIATTLEDARAVVARARARRRKLVLGYVLRHHPSWTAWSRSAAPWAGPWSCA